MNNRLFFAIIFGFVSVMTYAQENPVQQPADTTELEIAEADILFKETEDSASFAFYALPTDVEYIPGNDLPALVEDRLSCLQQTIPLTYNERVHSFINYFTVRDREYTRMRRDRRQGPEEGLPD